MRAELLRTRSPRSIGGALLALIWLGCADGAADATAGDQGHADEGVVGRAGDGAALDAGVGAGPDAVGASDGPPGGHDLGEPDATRADGGRPDDADAGPPPGCRGPAGLQTIHFDFDGRPRQFALYVPEAVLGRPAPVVVDLHGRTLTAEVQAGLSGMRAAADAHGFIALHPQGATADLTWNAGVCCGEAKAAEVDDVGFIAAVLDRAATEACVDPARIFVTGISNGGFMAHRLGCELADRIAAIAPVAGTLAIFDCAPARPVSVLQFHGTSDEVVPYEGFFGFISVPQTTAAWVAHNGCSAGPAVYFEQDDVRCERWSDCREGVEVRLCTIEDGGHTWPGGFGLQVFGRTTQTISATEAMWAFFAERGR